MEEFKNINNLDELIKVAIGISDYDLNTREEMDIKPSAFVQHLLSTNWDEFKRVFYNLFREANNYNMDIKDTIYPEQGREQHSLEDAANLADPIIEYLGQIKDIIEKIDEIKKPYINI